jgi:hypothetical protein
MRSRKNPTPSKIASSPSKVDRLVMCAHYERCLDQAVKRKWRSFSCQKCTAFIPLQLRPSEWYLDSLACTVLIGIADFQENFKQKRRGGMVIRLQRMRSADAALGLGG